MMTDDAIIIIIIFVVVIRVQKITEWMQCGS